MLATETTSSEPTSEQPIGTIEFLMGTAVAVGADGRERVVVVGDALQEGEVVAVAGHSTVEIRLADDSLQRLSGDGTPGAKLLLAQNDAVAPTVATDATSDLAEQIRQAAGEGTLPQLLENTPKDAVDAVIGDLPDELATQVGDAQEILALQEPGQEPGGGTPAGEGFGFVIVPLDLPQPLPEAGFETEGLAFDFPEGIEGGNSVKDNLVQDLGAALPSLTITKSNVLTDADQSGGVSAGDTITYTYAVENTGAAVLTGVTVIDNLLASVTLSDLGGDGVGTLAVGATETGTLTYVVQDGDAGNAITNVATADSDQTDPNTDTNTVTVQSPSLDITKSNVLTDADQSGSVTVGDTITYTYAVENTGEVVLTGVTVSDDQLGPVTLSDGGSDGADTLAVGATETGTLTYVVQPSDVRTAITNVATADSDQTGPDTDTNTVTVPGPSLDITKTNVLTDADTSGGVSAGDTITYTYTVANTGPVLLDGVTVIDNPLGPVTLSDAGGDGAGTLAVGATETGTLSYVVQPSDVAAGSIVNVATADSNQTGPVTDTNTVTVASLDITKTNVLTDADNSGGVSAGDTITYTYTVANTGAVLLDGVTVIDNPLGPVTLSDAGGDGVGTLAAGATETGTLTYLVQPSDVTAGSIVNLATADSNQTNPVTDTNTVAVPSLDITKTNVLTDADNSGGLSAGDTITYTYTVANTGAVLLDGVTVIDNPLGPVTLSDAGGDGAGTLAVGATETGTLSYVVLPSDVAAGSIVNVATADSNQTGPVTDTNTVAVPSLDITKTNVLTDADNSGGVSAGDTITYTYTVANTGAVLLDGVTVIDNPLGPVTLSDAGGDGAGTLAAGATETGTLSYVVQPSDVAAGSIVNLATADSNQTGPVTDTNTVTVASLDITKTNVLTDADNSGGVSAGDTITYTYTVANTGPVLLDGVTVIDNPLGPVTLSDAGGDGAGTLAVGATETGTLSYVVQPSDVAAGSIVNVATADSNQTGPVTDTNTVAVPSLDITKTNVLTDDADQSGGVSAGDTITYTYTVENTGAVLLDGVTVIDSPLGPVTLSDAGGDGAGTLAVGATETGTLTYLVQPSDVTAGSIVNLATADSNQTNPVTDTNTVTVQQLTTLSISDAMVREGTPLGTNATIQFTVTRGGDTNKVTTVNFAVSPGTAQAVTDYTSTPNGPLSGTLTFAIGEVTKDITLDVVDDLVPELNEQFTVTLDSPSNAALVLDANGNASGVAGEGTGTIKELVLDLDGDNSSLAPADHTFGADLIGTGPDGIIANFESSYVVAEQGLPVAGQTVRIADADTAIFLADGSPIDSPITQATITLLNPVPGDTFTFTDTLSIKGTLSGDTLTLEPVAQTASLPDWVDALESVIFNPTTDISTPGLDRLEPRFASVQVEDAAGSSNVAITAMTPYLAQGTPLSTVSVFTPGDLNPATPPDLITGFDQNSGFNIDNQIVLGLLDLGDVLELSDLIQGMPDETNIDQFVKIDNTGADSDVSVDSDGAGSAASFEVVAVLDGITSGQVNVMVGDHDTLLQVNVV